MRKATRRTDRKGRVTLFNDFADRLVIVEQVSDDELRVVKAKAVPKRYSLARLLEQVTDDNVHGEVDMGPAVGKEAWG